MTSCKPPCQSYIYTIVGSRNNIITEKKFGETESLMIFWIINFGGLGYNIMLANMEITEESEHYMYDFESFVSEFGGISGTLSWIFILNSLGFWISNFSHHQKCYKKNCLNFFSNM